MVAKIQKQLCVLICIVTTTISWMFEPCKVSQQITKGIITTYEEEVELVKNPKGGKYNIEFFYIYINSTKVFLPSHLGQDTLKGKEWYWKSKFEGRPARICYRAKNSCLGGNMYYLHDIELEDGSYSYHDPHDISYYDVGWFPFCISAPIALFCTLTILRFLYLLTFASDERRQLVFGDPNYSQFK